MNRLYPGPRMLKTALAVAIAVLIAHLLTQTELSLFYAGFGALIAMETTLSKALRQGLVQLTGVFCGTLLGYTCGLLFPPPAPFWAAGLGALLLLLLLHNLHMDYAASLACVIFLSASLIPTENLVGDSVQRLLCTAIGLATALVINIAIRPYNNRRRIVGMLHRLRQTVADDLAQVVVRECFPDLQREITLLRQLDHELELYHSQRILHRRGDDEALLRGCFRLAERMTQELEAICGMDSLGDLSLENGAKLLALGLPIPEAGIQGRKCTRQDTLVMNYHLEKLLSAYSYLDELLRT